MLKAFKKEDLNQVSLTGIRSLVLLKLLCNSPKSLEEIRQAFIEYQIMDDSNSDDILRIDINTLRTMGCEISRADHRTGNKYVLMKHPFRMNISQDEVNVVRRAFNRIKENADISLLVLYDELFKKIAPHIADNDIKDALLGISPLKRYSSEILNELRDACKNKNVVKLLYKAPNQRQETEKEVFADKIILQNDKLYFYGVDKNSKEQLYLNIKRILKVISQSNDDYVSAKPVTVKFKLTDFGISGLEDNENIESGDIKNGFIICGNYYNNFLATQRILSFGSKCTIIEPKNFKDNIVEILKKMRNIYNV